jgi:hypothetical protein
MFFRWLSFFVLHSRRICNKIAISPQNAEKSQNYRFWSILLLKIGAFDKLSCLFDDYRSSCYTLEEYATKVAISPQIAEKSQTIGFDLYWCWKLVLSTICHVWSMIIVLRATLSRNMQQNCHKSSNSWKIPNYRFWSILMLKIGAFDKLSCLIDDYRSSCYTLEKYATKLP